MNAKNTKHSADDVESFCSKDTLMISNAGRSMSQLSHPASQDAGDRSKSDRIKEEEAVTQDVSETEWVDIMLDNRIDTETTLAQLPMSDEEAPTHGESRSPPKKSWHQSCPRMIKMNLTDDTEATDAETPNYASSTD